MRLEHLTLRGFMDSFADKEVSIDFTALPDGLIALVGDNGAGKTTLLEAGLAAIYREPISRKGALEKYAKDRDSFISPRWSIGGETYTARLSIDGIKGGSTAALRRDRDQKAMNPAGNVTTYDAAVSSVFPPLHLVKASGIAAQNKSGAFVKASKSDRRDIMNAALNLAYMVEMSQTAKHAAAEVEKGRVRLKSEIDALNRDVVPTDDLVRQLAALSQSAVEAATRRDELQHDITVAEQKLTLLTDHVSAHAAAAQRVAHAGDVLATKEKTLQAHLDADAAAGAEESRQLNELTIEHARKVKSVTDRCKATEASNTTELEAIASDLQTKLADIAKRLKGNAELLAMKGEIESAVATIKELTPTLVTLRAQVDEYATLERRLAEELAAAEKALSAFTTPQSELDRAKSDAALLAGVPCSGRGEFAGCQLLVNAWAAEYRIASLETQLAVVVDAVTTRDRLATEKAAAHAAWSTAKTNADGVARRITDCEPKAEYAQPLAANDARVQELELARVAAEEDAAKRSQEALARHVAAAQVLFDERTEIDRVLDEATSKLQARVDTRLATVATVRAELQVALASATQAHADAVAELEQLAAGNTQATELQAYLLTQRADRDTAVTAIATAQADAAAVERRLLDIAVKAMRLETLRARLSRLDTQLLEWQLLQKALDRDGLPALETDQAGPEISATTNLILQDCFESRFSVELVTQVAKADGKAMKDDITLLVTDNHSGEVRDIADLSGGEDVIVGEAFMNAIAIFVNARSASPMETLFRDETTGPLTKANTQRYIRMLRKVLEIAGARQIVFISHDPDAQVLADAQLHVAGGAVTVVMAPYGVAA